MANLLGIISPLQKFLSNSEESIRLSLGKENTEILSLKENRIYNIPDFQREIRWTTDNVALLIEDLVSGSKYLGNIILTDHVNNTYSIIDGQQRLTILTMILSSIKQLHSANIDTITPCKLNIESFERFSSLIQEYFPAKSKNNSDILNSDKLHQIEKYYDLWTFICSHDNITNQRHAQKLLKNLSESTINIIMNTSDNISDGISYFIDVNLKGKQLDTEDIFKSYLFKNDKGSEIRDAWYILKANATNVMENKLNYPLLKLLEHYFYCDLYTNHIYKGLEFGEDFVLKKEFKTKKDSPDIFRKGEHLIELIANKRYMLNSLENLNENIEVILDIVTSSSPTQRFTTYFSCINNKGSHDCMDQKEIVVIHNFMNKTLKDSNIVPKSLIMKYILNVLLDKTPKLKSEYRKIYGVYLLSVLFVVFENKKSKDAVLNVLKANKATWYSELIAQISTYFSNEKITDNRLLAQYKLTTNESESDYRFRCKSLATIYNFFIIEENEVKIRPKKLYSLETYISNDMEFSIEHFIINNAKSHQTTISLGSDTASYTYNENVYKKYVNTFFNFIFIPKSLNGDLLSDYWLPYKLNLLNQEENKLHCEYTKLYLTEINDLSSKLEEQVKDLYTSKDALDLFFSRDFKDIYISFARNLLKHVLNRISTIS